MKFESSYYEQKALMKDFRKLRDQSESRYPFRVTTRGKSGQPERFSFPTAYSAVTFAVEHLRKGGGPITIDKLSVKPISDK